MSAFLNADLDRPSHIAVATGSLIALAIAALVGLFASLAQDEQPAPAPTVYVTVEVPRG